MGTELDLPDSTGSASRFQLASTCGLTSERTQRIVVCDRSGHPFQVQLSRELARRGHPVLHLYWSDFVTPHGRLDRQSADPLTFNVAGVSIGESHAKTSFIRRRRQEKQFGRLAWKHAWAFGPDAFLSCNMPLDAQAAASRACTRKGIRLVYWLQDIYGLATSRILASKMGLGGRLIGQYYEHMERRLLRTSDHIICISNGFADIIASWKIPTEKCTVIPNWAPEDEIRAELKQNSWARSRGLHNKKVVMYSGTLGFKHNIGMIVAAADRMRSRPDVMFVVISEGEQAERLGDLALKMSLGNIEVLPFQPYERYSDVLGTADVLIGFIDGDAGVYSVPSKVLSYLCAGRPIVLAAPEENLASKTVVEAEAGLVVSADSPAMFAQAIADLLDDDARRAGLGRSARKYAEARFDIGRIADKFEAILAPAAAVPPHRRSACPDRRRPFGNQRWASSGIG